MRWVFYIVAKDPLPPVAVAVAEEGTFASAAAGGLPGG